MKSSKDITNEGLLLNILINDDLQSLFELYEKGLDINQQFFWYLGDLPDILTNSPPLISVSVYYKSIKCFKFLLDNGVDINKLDEVDTPISHFAIAGGNLEIIEQLNEKGIDFNNTLHIAAENGQFEVFIYLYKNKNLSLNFKDQYKRTYLHIASSSGNVELVKFLIENGLNINEIDGTGVF